MNILRSIYLLLLFASLTASSSFALFSQARAMGGEAITICSPSGAHEIIIDANGQQVPPQHDCFDCCISLNSAIRTDSSQLIARPLTTQQCFAAKQSQWNSTGPFNFRVRGPPAIV